MSKKTLAQRLALPILAFSAVIALPAYAASTGNVLLEEVVTTATKKPDGISVQDVPLAVTAFDEAQIDALHMRDVKSLAFSIPNVQLDDVGTFRGVANFSIRGLGINSSIPGIDPTVGMFIDGMYYGLNMGVVMDTFDLAGAEVLRGPQGLLFGRNVTGGAVLLRTTLPGDEFSMNSKFAVESGLNYVASTVISGPLTDKVGGKIALYYNDDRGYHDNDFDGNDNFGDADTRLVRGALTYAATDTLDFILRYENGDSQSDGPASKNHGLSDRDNFDFAIDEEGYSQQRWNNASLETNWDVNFGEGRITNILGYRDYKSDSLSDIDASPFSVFNGFAKLDQDQLSNELRYAGNFGPVSITSGVYYFTQDIDYIERRMLFGGAANFTGGGKLETETWGFFSQADISLTDQLVLTLGGRYSTEKKEGDVANLALNGCDIDSGACVFDFSDSEDWDSFTPKIGLQWLPDESTQYYISWTKGFRSGGYNLRNTDPSVATDPFDQETQRSYEIGMKKDFMDGRVRLNASAFHNKITDMQRELNEPGPIGVNQTIVNSATAIIKGFELEATALITDNFTTQVFAGYIDGSYDQVNIDLNTDGIINGVDKGLDLPRLSPWEYGATFIYDHSMGDLGMLTAMASFSHRDAAAYTDSNVGTLNAVDMIDASLDWAVNDNLTISAYGKNLKDEVTVGGDTQLPFFAGSTFSPLGKGRILGVEIQHRY